MNAILPSTVCFACDKRALKFKFLLIRIVIYIYIYIYIFDYRSLCTCSTANSRAFLPLENVVVKIDTVHDAIGFVSVPNGHESKSDTFPKANGTRA